MTQWLEIPMSGRPYGVFTEGFGNKDRSRLTLKVKRMDDVTRISFKFGTDRAGLSEAERPNRRLGGGRRTPPRKSCETCRIVSTQTQETTDAPSSRHVRFCTWSLTLS